jgi:tetratricopeptide (TPR) repeat protein/2-polyprenyl-3-methyl-5-hydroxy-6-metoxy-1,4-benzoquinol methylase
VAQSTLLLKRTMMRDSERIRQNTATSAVDELPTAPKSPAVALIDEGNTHEEQGLLDQAMACYDAAVLADPQCARAHLNRGNVLLAGAHLDEARGAYELAIACDPQYAAAHFNLGNLNYRAGQFESAVSNHQLAVGIKPDFVDAFVGMANALDSLGRSADAVESYERALAINPGYAEVHFNLGLLAASQGRSSQAASSLRRAVEIKPDFGRAHFTLGTLLSSLGQLDEAAESLRRALSLEPQSAEILYNLAIALLSNGKSPEALELIVPALERNPSSMTKMAFIGCIARTRFLVDASKTRSLLTTAITEPWGMPYELCRPALSLIMLKPRIADCVRLSNRAWPARLPKTALFGEYGLAAFAADRLLHAVLETTPVITIEFERFLTCARHALLETAASKNAADPLDNSALQFYAALAQQCFINEYIFDRSDSEVLLADVCRTQLLALLDAGSVVPPLLLLAVAAYFPLYTLRNPGRLLAGNEDSRVNKVLRQQIQEPLEEHALRAGIERLTSITDGVSEVVREQYEQNPYPRWVKMPVSDDALHFNNELRRTLPFATFTRMRDDSAPELLIAGCGTGGHSILAAKRFRDARVLAIDLSLSSICYAKRKALEMGVTNIDHAQADILRLGDLTRTFDVIESVGVLHHLGDPLAGWRTLLSLLRPGGFMRLGFYSEVARRHVVRAREFIAAQGYAGTPDDIRRFRQDLAVMDASMELQWLSGMPDFYSTSECRDLLFHVQEHRLSLGQIDSFLTENGLHFIGFELDPRTFHRYRALFAGDQAGTNLRNWERLEVDYPDTFAGMYQFWIQKPAPIGIDS